MKYIDLMTNASSHDVVCAGDWKEFFYEETDKVVPEGQPIGFDVDADDNVELILFNNIYWNPKYED